VLRGIFGSKRDGETKLEKAAKRGAPKLIFLTKYDRACSTHRKDHT
jgi:hypothetical protein